MNLVKKSLQLDIEFLSLKLSLIQKIDFLIKKYFTLFNIFLFGFKDFQSITIFGHKYFYDDKFGLGLLQATFVDNYYLKSFISENSIVIAVGANIGQFNIFCKKYLNCKKVYSFEPIKKTYKYLRRNCPDNTVNAAISTRKKLNFYLPTLSVWASSIKPECSNLKQETVRGLALDSIDVLNKLPIIDLLKIDVEGAEKDVLMASKNIIKKTKYILIELSLSREAAVGGLEIIEILKKLSPGIQLVRIGKIYNGKDEKTGAADLLFSNLKI